MDEILKKLQAAEDAVNTEYGNGISNGFSKETLSQIKNGIKTTFRHYLCSTCSPKAPDPVLACWR